MSRASFKDFLRAAWMGRIALIKGITVPINIAWADDSIEGKLSILILYDASKTWLSLLRIRTVSAKPDAMAGTTYRKL